MTILRTSGRLLVVSTSSRRPSTGVKSSLDMAVSIFCLLVALEMLKDGNTRKRGHLHHTCTITAADFLSFAYNLASQNLKSFRYPSCI